LSLLSDSKKGKGKGPSIPDDENEDEIVPDSEASLGYDELAVLDEDDSDFEGSDLSSDYDDDDDSDEVRDGRKSPCKKASRVKVVDYDDPEDEETTLNTAIAASIGYSTNGGASTSATHASRTVSTRVTRAAATAERRLAMEQCIPIDSDVVLDSDPEGEILALIDSEDETISKKPKPRSGNRKDKKKTEDIDNLNLDSFSARREARRHSRLEKQQIRMLEYQLSRRLTYVSLASFPMV
jgi:hypothetical protein